MDLCGPAFEPPSLTDFLDGLAHLLRTAACGHCPFLVEFGELYEQPGDDLHEGADRGEDAAYNSQVIGYEWA